MSDCHSCADQWAEGGCDFLNPEFDSNVSRTIEINGDFAYIIKGYNLQPGQHAIVELVSGYGSATMYTPFIVDGRRMELNVDTTLLVLKNTGRYRVVVVDDAGAPVTPGLLMPTLCAEKADQSCGCSPGTDLAELPVAPCPPVTVTLDATVAKQITASVSGGPGSATLMPGGLTLLGNGPFVFMGLADATQYVVTFVSDCGSKAAGSAMTLAAVVPPVYCPSFALDACGCDEMGFGYRDNALRDPAATVAVTACDGETVMWIYPAAGVTGTVRHEVPYSEDDITTLGYMANNSDCAPPQSAITNVQVTNNFAPTTNVAAPVVNNAFSPTTNVAAPNVVTNVAAPNVVTNVAAPTVVLPAPNLVAAQWLGDEAVLQLTRSDGTVVTTPPIPACDN